MFDDPDTPGVFDFDELADHLLEQGAEVSPAQVHGCLSGLLAAGELGEGERALDALAQGLELEAHGELAERIMQLYSATSTAMDDDACSFYPLLPDDELELDTRTMALAQWCAGFLRGIAHTDITPGAEPRQWSSDGREILEDIAAMAQAWVGTDVDEDDEGPEDSYAELVEYLRVAVLNLYLERRLDEPDDLPDGPITLH
jgi:uncharacterized protein YgfB (UPF0149 family)